jgi:DNA modification methylase
VAFSSPPYFNLEAYSNEPTQSHVKFNEVNSWLDGYMRKTMENCFTLLKPGGHFAINIKDTQPYSFVDQILDAAKQIGFKPAATWQMEMKQRRGHGMPNDVHFNYEPIYVMQKP